MAQLRQRRRSGCNGGAVETVTVLETGGDDAVQQVAGRLIT